VSSSCSGATGKLWRIAEAMGRQIEAVGSWRDAREQADGEPESVRAGAGASPEIRSVPVRWRDEAAGLMWDGGMAFLRRGGGGGTARG
jgi:hypothetical protein